MKKGLFLLGGTIFLLALCPINTGQTSEEVSMDHSFDISHENVDESFVSIDVSTDEGPSTEDSSYAVDIDDESNSSNIFSSIVSDFTSPEESFSQDISDTSDAETSEDEVSLPILEDKDLADLSLYVDEVYFDMRYATDNNIAKKVIYDDPTPCLRFGTVKKLLAVVEELREYGYTLLVWDAYRRVEYQWVLWEAYPDPTYVADPNRFYSDHSRGDAIDVTLVTLDGTPVEMPTDHDDFTKKADRDYRDVSDEAAKNAKLLEKIMKKHGFKGYDSEWWHYSDTVKYSVIK